MKRMAGHGEGGFTLVELLIVISVLAVLAAILIPTFSTVGRNQKKSTCFNNLRELGVALAQYREDYDAYPAAPRREYLYSQGVEYDAMPLSDQVASVEQHWKEQNILPIPLLLDTDATAGSSAVSVELPAVSYPVEDILPPQTRVLLSDPATGIAEMAVVSTVNGQTVTFAEDIDNDYAAGSAVDPRYRNFGLATLYYQYLNDESDYVRGRQLYHCPAMRGTEGVDLGANVAAVGQEGRTFDPLWSGFNTYDITYNYDQYGEDISNFDTAMGMAGMNENRQLRNANPPADTVVCWCYAHQPEPTPSVTVPAGPSPIPDYDLTDMTAGARLATLDKAESAKKSQVSLVLWVDGTVSAERPRLMRLAGDADKFQYFWVPPFLYSTGEWRE